MYFFLQFSALFACKKQAGGGSLHLLQKSGIPEGKGIGGFPVSGLFMVCNNPDIIE